MRFSPSNEIVRLCIQGMGLEEGGRLEEARKIFLRAWNEATDDHARPARPDPRADPHDPTRVELRETQAPSGAMLKRLR